MVENQTWSRDGMKYKLLFFLERKLSRHASTIISATEGMHDHALRKYKIDLKYFYVKPACTDFSLFNSSRRKNTALMQELKLTGKTICVYAGKFGGIYLTREVFDFFSEAEKIWGDNFRSN